MNTCIRGACPATCWAFLQNTLLYIHRTYKYMYVGLINIYTCDAIIFVRRSRGARGGPLRDTLCGALHDVLYRTRCGIVHSHKSAVNSFFHFFSTFSVCVGICASATQLSGCSTFSQVSSVQLNSISFILKSDWGSIFFFFPFIYWAFVWEYARVWRTQQNWVRCCTFSQLSIFYSFFPLFFLIFSVCGNMCESDALCRTGCDVVHSHRSALDSEVFCSRLVCLWEYVRCWRTLQNWVRCCTISQVSSQLFFSFFLNV